MVQQARRLLALVSRVCLAVICRLLSYKQGSKEAEIFVHPHFLQRESMARGQSVYQKIKVVPEKVRIFFTLSALLT